MTLMMLPIVCLDLVPAVAMMLLTCPILSFAFVPPVAMMLMMLRLFAAMRQPTEIDAHDSSDYLLS